MMVEIRPEVYQRIVLAKSLHKAGEAACSTRNDQMAFTKGILLLHDAGEAALGAVADHLNVNLTGNRSLLDYFDLIKEADTQNRTVPFRTQMRNLNTLRNNSKHQGLLPDPQSNAHFPTTVCALIEEICQTYLGLDFSSVSLKSLIRRQVVEDYIDQADQRIEIEEIEAALISLAYAMFHICDFQTIPFPFFKQKEEEEKLYRFTEHYTIDHTVRLLECGVDPYLYHRFKNLTPEIGRHADTNELHYYWDKSYGHPANWTIRNARFCLDFCIETGLKFQREDDEGYTLIDYSTVYEDVIEPAKDEATFWNQSIYPPKYPYPKPSKARAPILNLKKGESIVGVMTDSKDRLDEWYIVSSEIPTEAGGAGLGFVLKDDVKVTRRKRQIPKEINDLEEQQGEKEGTDRS